MSTVPLPLPIRMSPSAPKMMLSADIRLTEPSLSSGALSVRSASLAVPSLASVVLRRRFPAASISPTALLSVVKAP